MERIIRNILKMGVGLPLWLKGGLVERGFSSILRRYRGRYKVDHILSSNMGIKGPLRIGLSVLEAPPMFFFGKPSSYTGEYYTIELVSFLTKYCSTFVDVGANWGFFSYYVHNLQPNLPIYWFEPNPALYKSIITNSEKNGLKNMTGSELAISDTDGELSFYVETGSGFNSSLIEPEDLKVSKVTVKAVRFENWVKTAGIGNNLLVKVDVENAEWNFIKGAAGALDKIDFLVMEVLGPARQSGFVDYMINELKMQAYYINKDLIEHVVREDMRYTIGEYNWLFCRQTPDKLREQLAGSIFTTIA